MLVVVGLPAVLMAGFGHDEDEGRSPISIPQQRPRPYTSVPRQAPEAPTAPDEFARGRVVAWAGGVSEATGLSRRAVAAYGWAEMWLRRERPGCRLSWTTLAGIARVESWHGTYGGAEIGHDGRVTRPIVGIALDGSPGVRAVPDTDGGRLDGDPTWDRAVGPMQFLPATWRRWAVRANGDGAAPDPQNIDDAALAAARYLCADGRDLSEPADWWSAVLTYNNSVDYTQDVFSGADAYAAAAQDR